MLLRIARHEFRDVVRDGRFRLAAAIVGGLLVGATLTGWSYQRSVSAEHAAAAALSRDTWLSQSAKDPHSAAHYGAYVFKPRGPLTLIDSGVSPYTGVAAWLEAHKQNEFQFRPAQDRAGLARLSQLTAALTLQGLVPVLIILLAFAKFAGEREDGTLRQVVAAGVSPRLLASGKALGVAWALALVLVPASLLGGMALLWTSDVAGIAESLPRLVALVGLYGTYFACFVGLALAVSATTARASHALAILVAFWACNVTLAPRLTTDVARARHPAPTAVEFQSAVHRDTYEGLSVHDYNLRRAPRLRARLFAEHGVTRVEDLPVNFRGIDYLEREAQANAIWDTHYSRLWAVFDRQASVHLLASFVAPLLAVRSASMAFSGADFEHHRHFARAAEEYRRQLVIAMNSDLAYGGSSARRGSYAADPALWSTVRPFDYTPPSASWAAGHVTTPLVALAGWLTMAGLALSVAVRRMVVE